MSLDDFAAFSGRWGECPDAAREPSTGAHVASGLSCANCAVTSHHRADFATVTVGAWSGHDGAAHAARTVVLCTGCLSGDVRGLGPTAEGARRALSAMLVASLLGAGVR